MQFSVILRQSFKGFLSLSLEDSSDILSPADKAVKC